MSDKKINSSKKKKASSAKRAEKAKRARRKKIHTIIFYSVYGACAVAALAAIAVGTRVLREKMTGYEASQPKYAAERAAQVFVTGDYETMYAYEDTAAMQAGNETQAQYVRAMSDFVAGRPITWREERTGDENLKRYAVRAGDERMGEFTMRLSDELDDYGYRTWQFDSLSTDVLKTQTYTVTAPAGCTVYVDGFALTDDAVVEEGIKLFDTASLPEGTEARTMRKWQFNRYFGVNEVRVEDMYGEENAVTREGDDWTAAFNYDDSRLNGYEERVVEVVRKLSCYMTGDFGETALSYGCLVESSPAAAYVKAFDDGWIMPHRGYDFLNMDVSHYISYSPDCFSVETRYDYKIIYKNSEEIYPTAYRLYFQQKRGEWYLYNFTVI